MDILTEIDFFQENVEIDFKHRREIAIWIEKCVFEETGYNPSAISTIFCNDAYLLEINQKYLDHDTFTDIITFQYTDKPISGDLFISIERVKENADNLGLPFDNELHRVIIHGVLHLCGYQDKTEDQAQLMRQKEDFYLSILRIGHI